MKACGIVAEYNPFHNGHAYHVQQTKERAKCDVVIAIMSGNFVQRGECAIVDKWQRTQVALAHGVDVVIELPSVYAVQAADYFAYGAMKIAHALNIHTLAFGVETITLQQLNQLAKETLQTPKNFRTSFQQQWAEQSSLLRYPNNQLAVSYTKALYQLQSSVTLLPITRMASQHNDTHLTNGTTIASGTAIRNGLYHNKPIKSFVSEQMYHFLNERMARENKTDWQHTFWTLLRYRIVTLSLEQLRSIYQVVEGIEYVLKKTITTAQSYDHFLHCMQSKRWSKARLQRLCHYIVLDFQQDWVTAQMNIDCPLIRVLGWSACGKAYMKQCVDVPYMTQLKKEHVPLMAKQSDIDTIFNHLTQTTSEQNYRRIVTIDETTHSKT